ncbi:MAG: N-6 DNA methylase [Ferrovum myxofaciens]|nr:N-6 DNA methylase [Ferrovum myxofaciens]QSH81923.1 MAG: N-6 DNA methylase [Ferrovum myxofaciens]
MPTPPFNIKGWGADKLPKDPPLEIWGYPPDGNANYAWLQHMLARLSADGRTGIVLANGSLTTNTSGEGDIRASMVKGDVVECMVSLPGQLFANTQIPACLWFLSKNKGAGKNGKQDRRGQILFIDARKLAILIPGSRKQKEFSEDEIRQIAQTYHNWRGTQWGENGYEDVPGFCKSSSLDEIEKHGFALTPGRYVGATDVEDDDEVFEEQMTKLTSELKELFSRGSELEQEVRTQLGRVGYDI